MKINGQRPAAVFYSSQDFDFCNGIAIPRPAPYNPAMVNSGRMTMSIALAAGVLLLAPAGFAGASADCVQRINAFAARPVDAPAFKWPKASEEEGLDIGKGLATVALVVGLIILIGLAAVVALIIVVAALLLLTITMASTSMLIGVKKQSVKWGVKWFFIQGLGVAGILCGPPAFWAAARILEVSTPRWVKIVVGGGIGLIVGVLSALLISRVLGAIYRRLIRGNEEP
jgi:hypothetical protein